MTTYTKNILILLNIGVLVYGPVLVAHALFFLKRYIDIVSLPKPVRLGIISMTIIL